VQLPKPVFELEFAHGSVYGAEERQAVLDVLDHSAPSCGPRVKEFEEAFAAYCGAQFGLAATSATTGLELAMIAANLQPGDEVITTPVSWISTANVIQSAGAKAVFADVEPHTLNLDPKSVAEKVTPRTRAILPVHLYGQCCAMDELNRIAADAGALVVEDAAHAAGADYRGRKAGALGDIGVFSFHQQKNMVTLGEGGMITTSDRGLYERMLSYRSLCCRTYDPKGKYLPIDESAEPMGMRYWRLEFDGIGFNFRMTDMQAAVGLVQLRKLDALNGRRIEIARAYSAGLAGIKGLKLLTPEPDRRHVYHIYAVLIAPDFPLSKEEFMWRMYTEKRIKVWSHYIPIHLTDVYRKLGHRPGECPVAESLAEQYVSLPIHPRMTGESIQYVIDSIRQLSGVEPA
jgi:dTDP-4-amino-4,6-dideoxygalactose transaminase